MANKYDNIVQKLEGRFDFLSPEKVGNHITEAQLSKVELQLGHTLPSEYKEFLSDYGDYGFSRVSYPLTREDGHISEEDVFIFYGVSHPSSSIVEGYHLAIENPDTFPIELYPGLSLVREVKDGIEMISWPSELLPIACDKGGNQICLALMGLRLGAVFYWTNAPHRGDQNLYLIANSFDEFMHLLYREDEV